MFMRVGGGIFTKAADVGADLVGKVENHIPEDDPRNAATIADNVGDNVGDCAGMAADLFESYAVTLVAALILGKVAFGEEGLIFPLIVTAIGAFTAAIGIFITKVRKGESGLNGHQPRLLHLGHHRRGARGCRRVHVPAFHVRRLQRLATHRPRPRPAHRCLDRGARRDPACRRHPVAHGLLHRHREAAHPPRGAHLSYWRGHRCPRRYRARSVSPPCTRLSSSPARSLRCSSCAGSSIPLALFLVALAGCGLLTTVGVIVAMDTFGPVSDNAQGIAEMSGEVDEEAAKILTDLDAVGNTTKAITKGIAIATAVLAATALFGSYSDAVATAIATAGASIDDFSYAIINPITLVGVIIGGATVFLFSGLAIDAVTRAAGAIVFEVRRQFREMPGIMDGTQRPEYGRVVDICTRDSLRELTTPGLLAATAPIFVGMALGPGALCGLPRRRHRHRRADGRLPRQLRRLVGQRQEDRRGRPLRRQELGGSRGRRHRRHRG